MANRFYACSDLHGNLELYNKILNLLDDSDTLIYLGDACDRGPDGVKIMQSLLSKNNIVYLLGNHERMFLNAVKMNAMDYYDKWGFNFYNDMELWASNGGQPTYQKYLELDIEEQEQLRKNISKLPIYAEYNNKNNQHLFLCHSGIDLDQVDKVIKEEREITFNKGYSTAKIYKTDEKSFIWNRNHLSTPHWPSEDKYNNMYLIHGHTPTLSLFMFGDNFEKTNESLIKKYCDEHKIDIDLGTYATNTTCLLDLDTLEPIYVE